MAEAVPTPPISPIPPIPLVTPPILSTPPTQDVELFGGSEEASSCSICWYYCCMEKMGEKCCVRNRCISCCSTFSFTMLLIIIWLVLFAPISYVIGLPTQLLLNGGTKDFTFDFWVNMFAGAIGAVILMGIVGIIVFVGIMYHECGKECREWCGECKKSYSSRNHQGYQPLEA